MGERTAGSPLRADDDLSVCGGAGRGWLSGAAVALICKRYLLVMALVLIMPAKLWSEHVIKSNFQRESDPKVYIPDAILRGDVPASGLSFVSGHAYHRLRHCHRADAIHLATAARCCLVDCGAVHHRQDLFGGAHLPRDVLGGAICGTMIGLAAPEAHIDLCIVTTLRRRRGARLNPFESPKRLEDSPVVAEEVDTFRCTWESLRSQPCPTDRH